MKRAIETPITFEEYGTQGAPINDSEELDWLMSLALDDALEVGEADRLEVLLRQEPENLARWAAWQSVDAAFHEVPSVLPPVDFGEKFALRLEIHERQRRLRTGMIFGLAAVALWGSALVGFAILGALVWSNQGEWLGGLIHNWAYWWSVAQQFGRALVNTGEALWSAPQTRAVIACYVVVAVAILVGWLGLLRRSMRELPPADVQMMEA
jgi:anti-sigma factor RsiW